MIIDFGIRHFHHIPSSYKFSDALQSKLKTLTGTKKIQPPLLDFFGSVTLNKHIFFSALSGNSLEVLWANFIWKKNPVD